jgi:hypothetical protein
MPELKRYSDSMDIFWEGIDTAPPKKRQRKSYAEVPRMATLISMREADNAMYNTFRRRYHDFVADYINLAKALDSNTLTFELLNTLAPILTKMEDQAPWQICEASFLKYVMDVNCVSLHDPAAHRMHNDWTDGGVGTPKGNHI